MTDLYTVELTLTDGDTHAFDYLTATNAQDCVAAFLARTAECTFEVPDGVFTWPWLDISSCKVTRQP